MCCSVNHVYNCYTHGCHVLLNARLTHDPKMDQWGISARFWTVYKGSGFPFRLKLIFCPTSHGSIAYRKQLPPQRTVGTIGSVWQESTPSKETRGPAQTRKAKGYESEQSEMPNGARAAFA